MAQASCVRCERKVDLSTGRCIYCGQPIVKPRRRAIGKLSVAIFVLWNIIMLIDTGRIVYTLAPLLESGDFAVYMGVLSTELFGPLGKTLFIWIVGGLVLGFWMQHTRPTS